MRKLRQIAHRGFVARTPLPARGEGLGEGLAEMLGSPAVPCRDNRTTAPPLRPTQRVLFPGRRVQRRS